MGVPGCVISSDSDPSAALTFHLAIRISKYESIKTCQKLTYLHLSEFLHLF